MMNFTELLNNTAALNTATTADPTVVATKVATELSKFVTANGNYDNMKAGILDANKKANKADPNVKLMTEAEADAIMIGMGVQKVDLVAKEAEIRSRIQAEEDSKAKERFYNMAEEAARLEAALNNIAQQNAPAPQESDLDKLIKLQTIQLQAQMQNQPQQNNNQELQAFYENFLKGFEDGVNNALEKIEEAAKKEEASKPSYYRPSNREQYEAHKSITRSKSAERGQLYADMKAGRITLGQYMAGCASTWSDAAAEHADVTARRRGYYI